MVVRKNKITATFRRQYYQKRFTDDLISNLTQVFRESIRYALNNRKEAVKYAMRFAQNMTEEKALKFIGRYVNDFTLEYGQEGQLALIELFTRASYAGIFSNFKQAK